MQPSATELETIVRVVMQRLAAGRELMAGVAEMAQAPAAPTELSVGERLVTTHTLEGRLAGMRSVRVGQRAVVTPAVIDMLRQAQIQLVRGTASPAAPARASSTSPSSTGAVQPAATAPAAGRRSNPSAAIAPTLVCGSALWFGSLHRHLCPKQASVEECSDDRAPALTERHLAGGGRRAVWLTSAPFAAAAAAGRNSSAVAVQLPSLAELAAALDQAQPQLLIVDAPRWTVAGIGNLVRTLARSQ